MSFTATYDASGSATASITLTIGTTPNANGNYAITGISGTWNGAAITGLIAASGFNGNDNLAVPPGHGGFDDLDHNGVSFTVVGGLQVQLFTFSSGGLFFYSDSTNPTEGNSITVDFNSNVPCFLRGTLIRTEHGDIAVEDLVIGDRVATVSGATLPIKWIGARRYLPDPLARKLWHSVAPIRVRKHAIADNVPCRDLYLSPDHSLFLAGHLINVKNLVNGSSIAQDTGIADIAYFHLELERHEVILANGTPAETYLDNGNRAQFHNAGDYAGPMPEQIAALDRWYAPHAYGRNEALGQLRRALLARAALLDGRQAEAA